MNLFTLPTLPQRIGKVTLTSGHVKMTKWIGKKIGGGTASSILAYGICGCQKKFNETLGGWSEVEAEQRKWSQ